jgi:predicted ferric reductase/Ca2+-binding EF-hand superfamily protein
MERTSRVSSIDERLLATLDRAFAAHAGGAARIDAAGLQKALGLRGEYLARRMLALFDSDGDGTIDREEFLRGVRAIVFGSDADKLSFAFRLHDHDGDGSIDASELRRMITLGLVEDDVTIADSEVDRLTALLLREADTNGDGRLSLAEFEAALGRHPTLLEQMTRSEARWIAPNEDLLARAGEAREGVGARVARLVANRRGSVIFLGVAVLVNVVIFALAMTKHGRGVPVGPAWLVQVGRACTTCIKVDVALLFFPVMRRLVTRVRESRFGRRATLLDDALELHKLAGYALVVFGLGHTVARLVSYSGRGAAGFAKRALGLEGLTGLALLVAMLVMWLFARERVRRSGRFELFYFTHLLYVPWIVLAVVHAPSILLPGGLAVIGFVAEQVLRLRRRARPARVLDARALRSGVTRLELARPEGFAHRAGDYVFLRIAEVAPHEWHPFTISSAPEAPTLTLHVRALGNWTSALRRRVEARAGGEGLIAHLDGPYGSPAGHVFDAETVVLIAAGIGVTPFASVLESLSLRARAAAAGAPGGAPHGLTKVHFFWLNRDQTSFEWFSALLADLEVTAPPGLIELHVYMTGGHGGLSAAGLEVARELARAEGAPDLVTGLAARTHNGHPEWTGVLGAIARAHAPRAVPVFFCGPAGLARKLEPVCAQLGMPFREEQF